MESLNLDGKVAIITGSSSGIGAASAKLMARRGAKVTLHGRDQGCLENVHDDLLKCGVKADDVLIVRGDVTDPVVRESLVTESLKKFGRIDILVNNAGSGDYNVTMKTVSRQHLTSAMDLLLFAPIFLSQLCQPHLAKTKGTIINISSAMTEIVSPRSFPYTLAKVGLDCFTKHAAVEFSKDGIRVNSINPGFVNTNILRNVDKKVQEQTIKFVEALAEKSLLGYNAQPMEIAEIVAFYASAAASFITADINRCDAGLTVNAPFKVVAKL